MKIIWPFQKIQKIHLKKFKSINLKILRKVCIEWTYLSIIKSMNDKATTNIIFNSGKLKAFPLRYWAFYRNKKSMLTLSTFIQLSIRSPSHSNLTRKKKKKNLNRVRAWGSKLKKIQDLFKIQGFFAWNSPVSGWVPLSPDAEVIGRGPFMCKIYFLLSGRQSEGWDFLRNFKSK